MSTKTCGMFSTVTSVVGIGYGRLRDCLVPALPVHVPPIHALVGQAIFGRREARARVE